MESPQQPVSASEVNVLRASGDLDHTRAFTEIHLTDGRIFRLNTRALGGTSAEQTEPRTEAVGDETRLAIPLIEEQLTIGKRSVPMGRVILEKTVQEYEHQLHEPLAVRTYDVERRVLNWPIDAAPAVRQEGETTIYPVVEEQLILTKQLILKEEVHVTRRDDERVDTRVVTLKREHLHVQREDLREQVQDLPLKPG